jgi:hypothetical protein
MTPPLFELLYAPMYRVRCPNGPPAFVIPPAATAARPGR